MLKIQRIIFKFNDFFYDTKWNWTIKFFHPHINGTFFCMGNKSGDQEIYANGLLYDFWLDVTKESLNTYSPDGVPYDTVSGVASTIALITSKIKSINFRKEMKDKTLEEKGEELFTRALQKSNLQKCKGCGNYILDGHCTHHNCHHNPDAHIHCTICNTEMVNVIRLGNSYGFNCPRPSCSMHVTIDYENFRMACSSCGQELENRNELLGNAELVCRNSSCDIRDLTQARYNRTTHTLNKYLAPACMDCGAELRLGVAGYYCHTNACLHSIDQYDRNRQRIYPYCPECDSHETSVLLDIMHNDNGDADSNIRFHCAECDGNYMVDEDELIQI